MRYRTLCKLIAVQTILVLAFFFTTTADICSAHNTALPPRRLLQRRAGKRWGTFRRSTWFPDRINGECGTIFLNAMHSGESYCRMDGCPLRNPTTSAEPIGTSGPIQATVCHMFRCCQLMRIFR